MKKILKLFSIFLLLGFSLQASASDASYNKILKKYHRRGEKFNFGIFHDTLLWDVVFKSAEFREAAMRKYAKDYQLSEEDLKAKLFEAEQDYEEGPEFQVILYTYDRKWNDLELKNSVWRVKLESGDQSFDPVKITKIKLDAINTAFYPYNDPWTMMYSVRFPREALTAVQNDFSLSIYGARGQNTLHWKISSPKN